MIEPFITFRSSEPPTCTKCAAWDPALNDPKATCGICRRRPPVPPVSASVTSLKVIWPETGALDGCAHFVADGFYKKSQPEQVIILDELDAKISARVQAIVDLGVANFETFPTSIIIAAAVTMGVGLTAGCTQLSAAGFSSLAADQVLGTLLNRLAQRRISLAQLHVLMEEIIATAQAQAANGATPAIRAAAFQKLQNLNRYYRPFVQAGEFYGTQAAAGYAVRGTARGLGTEALGQGLTTMSAEQVATQAAPKAAGIGTKCLRAGLSGFVRLLAPATAAYAIVSDPTDLNVGETELLAVETEISQKAMELTGLLVAHKKITQNWLCNASCVQCEFWVPDQADTAVGITGTCHFHRREPARLASDGTKYRPAPQTTAFDWCHNYTHSKARADLYKHAQNVMQPAKWLSCVDKPDPECCVCVQLSDGCSGVPLDRVNPMPCSLRLTVTVADPGLMGTPLNHGDVLTMEYFDTITVTIAGEDYDWNEVYIAEFSSACTGNRCMIVLSATGLTGGDDPVPYRGQNIVENLRCDLTANSMLSGGTIDIIDKVTGVVYISGWGFGDGTSGGPADTFVAEPYFAERNVQYVCLFPAPGIPCDPCGGVAELDPPEPGYADITLTIEEVVA